MAAGPEYAQIAYRAGEEAYRRGKFDVAAERFEQAYQIAKFPTIQYDIAQAYRRLWETEYDARHLQKAIVAYRMFLQHSPGAHQRPVAQRLLASLDVQLIDQESQPPTLTPNRPKEPMGLKAYSWELPANDPAVQKSKTPVYKKWWLWTTIGGVAAVGLAVGLSVGLTRWPQPDVCLGGPNPACSQL